eukprot:CAMPEP_0172523182 /NCGR_PEP_ID=MMETSP1066-20121228/293525_1 /TAXON_ID=671091 /ORGANISM="Coscinodiscus wailesii, Strain CCMP2513" /LENGTH=284 /DNA_ID=CAMNT_0013306241 /DNA_START=170 /DNA_END=1025 /DNA_ORIENTATION=+
MSSNNDSGEGPGALTAAVIIGIIAILVVTGIGPLLDTPGANDLNLGDSVVTRSVDGATTADGKLANYQSEFDKLSRSKIQEKLNRVPVFFFGGWQREFGGGGRFYLSFEDANEAAAAGGDGLKVKATTLDQVMYPLIFKRGRMRMAPPPPAIKKAEELLTSDVIDTSVPAPSFQLIPSKAALQDARDSKLVLANGDIPLFVAERLAFSGSDGPQVPLFLEKADCVTSYSRLRESSPRLAPEPTIRATTLKDVLYSMEKGTRPAVSQLQFYATADDLVRASEIMF